MEIVSTYLENEEAGANCLSLIREFDQKAGEIANKIVHLKNDLQTVCRFDDVNNNN